MPTPDSTTAPEPLPESASGWDVYSIALRDDPYPEWREIREQHPVLDAGGGVFFVTRWDLVDAVLRDSRHLAGAGVSASFGANDGLAFDAMRVWLMSLDGAEQTRARGLVRREFTPRRIDALRPFVAEVADRLVSEIEASSESEPIDLISRLAFPLPSEVIRSLFGIAPDEWREEVEAVVTNVGDAPEDGIAMIEDLARYFESLLAQHRVPSGLLAQLRIPDPELGALSQLEVIANAVLLVTAAIDTRTGLIGNTIHCLLEDSERLARVRAAPEQVAAAVEETLRFEPPALSCSRRAGVDLELAGVPIPAGSQLLLGLAAANRDPARYADPDRFSLDRDQTGLLSFGGGRHFCLGAALARMEAVVAVRRLLVDSPLDPPLEIALVEAPRWQKRNPTIRAHERLRVRRESIVRS